MEPCGEVFAEVLTCCLVGQLVDGEGGEAEGGRYLDQRQPYYPGHLYRRDAAEQGLHGDYRAETDGEPQYRLGPASLTPCSHPEQRGDVERQYQRHQAQDTNTYVEHRLHDKSLHHRFRDTGKLCTPYVR